MHNIWILFKRELLNYFLTPLAYILIMFFLLVNGLFTFYLGNFIGRGQADLMPFFNFHPWIYLFFIPAITMRIWAEERKSSTIELLLTLPISLTESVIAKFLASWFFTGIALSLTFPLWITVNILASPDNGAILAGYLGSFLLAGCYIAIGCCFSALTKNQVVAFVITLAVCLGFILSGLSIVLDFFKVWLPNIIVETISSFSFLKHFSTISRGVIDIRDLVFFASLITLAIYANTVIIEWKKGD